MAIALLVHSLVDDAAILVAQLHLGSSAGVSYVSSRILGHCKEGIRQVKETSQIFERLGRTLELTRCLEQLARLLYDNGQLDDAEQAALQSIKLLPEEGHECDICQSRSTLGDIYCSNGQREQAVRHYEVALGIASSFNLSVHLFWIHMSLAMLSLAEGELDDAYAHITQAKPHALGELYYLGRITLLQAV